LNEKYSHKLNACAGAPYLTGLFTIPPEGQSVVPSFQFFRDHHLVHQGPLECRLSWFNMILSVAKKSRRWRGELGSLVTVQVVLHISSIRFNTSWNGVPGPLGAWREGALPGSVCHELNSFAAFTVLHPLNVTSKVKYCGLEALFGQLLTVLAKPIAVSSSMVSNDPPTNLLSLTTLPLCGLNPWKVVILRADSYYARTVVKQRLNTKK